jgi:hypothetical protein
VASKNGWQRASHSATVLLFAEGPAFFAAFLRGALIS